ncbi:MAG TPA: GTP-binding protein [Candidatus Binatia bacterium]|nr:GTP-binding protein [Candidatus Binatia bacterium]
MPRTRVPVTVLSGFLGSGKTTRLNELLRDPRGRRVGVVMNELGAVGVELGGRGQATSFVELDGGCVCCTLNDDLATTLADLAARGGLDHLVIETTGIADPLAVAWLLERGALCADWRVDAVVTVVDAEAAPRLRAAAAEVDIQIARADVVLLSKLDLTRDGGGAVEDLVRAINARARILASPRGATPWDVLLDVGAPSHEAMAPVPHVHGVPWETWTFRTPATLDEGALEAFLYALPAGVVRAKGLVRTRADGWLTVHAVGGRYELEPSDVMASDGASVLVAIGRGLDAAALTMRAEALVAPSG